MSQPVINPFTSELDMVRNQNSATGMAVLTKTTNYVVTNADFGKSIRMNSASNRTFTMPSVGAAEDGLGLRLGKIGTGKVTIQTADSDKMGDGSAGGTAYLDDNSIKAAFLDLQYCHATTSWHYKGLGAWIIT